MWWTDLTGQWIEPGALRKPQEANFEDGTLPSWLAPSAAASGTIVAASPAAAGGVRLTSPATTLGDRAEIESTTPIDLADVEAVRLRVSLTYVSGRPMTWLGFAGTDCYFRMRIGYPGQGAFQASNSAAVTESVDGGPTHATGKRYHAMVYFTPRDRSLYYGQGNIVFDQKTFDPAVFNLGEVTAFVRAEADGTNAAVLDVHQVVLERWWR